MPTMCTVLTVVEDGTPDGVSASGGAMLSAMVSSLGMIAYFSR